MKAKTERFECRLTPSELKYLKRLAKEHDMSMSGFVAEGINGAAIAAGYKSPPWHMQPTS